VRVYLILLVILPLLYSCWKEKSLHAFEGWERSCQRAYEVAEERGKRVFIYFRAEWCSWCEIYDRTLSKPVVGNFIRRNFVPLLLDSDRDRKEFLRYGGRGVPFTVVTDTRGEPVIRFHGAMGAEDLLEVLKVALEGRVEVSEKRELYRIGRNLRRAFAELEDFFLKDLRERFDPAFGGFSSPSERGTLFKWPTPLTYRYLLVRELLVDEAIFTLKKDIEYLYDRVDLGFFNFFDRTRSFDLYFETSKSLQINSAMILALLSAYKKTGDRDFYHKAVGTYRYLERHLLDRESGCYLNAQKSSPRYYNAPPEERRSLKPPPPDSAIVVEYNALALWALYELFLIKEDSEILRRIRGCLGFIKEKMFREGRLFRYYDVRLKKFGLPNFARDLAMLALSISYIEKKEEGGREFALELLEKGGADDWVVRGIRSLAFINLGLREKAVEELVSTEVDLSYHNPDDMFFTLESLRLLSEMR